MMSDRERPRRARPRVLVAVLLLLTAWGVAAAVLLLDGAERLAASNARARRLAAEARRLQRQVYGSQPAERDEGADRAAHYVRKLARDLPGVSAEITNDPDAGNVAEYIESRLRYPGAVLSDREVEKAARALGANASTLFEYHRFIQRMPRVRAAATAPR